MARNGEGKTLAYLGVLVVLLAVLAGLVYSRWDTIRDRFKPGDSKVADNSPRPRPRRERPTPPARPVVPSDKPPVAPPDLGRPAVDEAVNADARKLIEQGALAMASGDFIGARTKFSLVDGLKCSGELRSSAKSMAHRATTFDDLTAPIAKSTEASGQLYHFELIDDAEFDAVIRSQDEKFYNIRKNSGIGMPIPRHNVRKVTPISKEDQKADLVERLSRLEGEIKPQSGVDFYRLAEFAWSNNLTEQSVKLLDKAYDADKSLHQSVIDQKAGVLLAKAFWHDAKNSITWARKYCHKVTGDYPASKHAPSAEELLASIEGREKKRKAGKYKATVRITGGDDAIKTKVERKIAKSLPQRAKDVVKVRAESTGGTGAASGVLREADQVFNKALQDYQQGRPGMPNFNRHLADAAKGFDNAMNLYEKAQRLDPKNNQIDNRMTDCQKYGYHARKMQTLGGF